MFTVIFGAMDENLNDRDLNTDGVNEPAGDEADYTTPGDPIRSERYAAEERDRDATVGDPLFGDAAARDEAVTEDGVDYTTPGNPIESPEHLAEEDVRHATTGEPLEDIDDDEI